MTTVQPKRVYTKKADKVIPTQTEGKKEIFINKDTLSDVEFCRTCGFVRNHVCKRYPPMIGNTAFIQPIVLDTDWCGCYKRAGK